MESTRVIEASFPPLPLVREIATGHNSSVVAVLELPETVSIWDLKSGRRLSQFKSFWDIGGRRLAVSEDGKFCCTGAYERYGVTLYKTTDGNEVWKRRDLRRVQNLRFSLYRNAVLAGIDQCAFHSLDASTGSDIESLRGVVDMWENPFGRHVFLEKKPDYEVLDVDSKEKKTSIKPSTFAVLDACFTEDRLAISEAAGPTSMYSLDNGTLVWRYSDPGHHNGKLAYCPQTHEIMALNRGLRKVSGNIVGFDIENGKATRNIPRDDLDIAAFALEGTRVITWRGNVVDTLSGEVVSRLNFHPTA